MPENEITSDETCQNPWDETIWLWLRFQHGVTISDVLRHAFKKEPGGWTRSDRIRIHRSLLRLGWQPYGQLCEGFYDPEEYGAERIYRWQLWINPAKGEQVI